MCRRPSCRTEERQPTASRLLDSIDDCPRTQHLHLLSTLTLILSFSGLSRRISLNALMTPKLDTTFATVRPRNFRPVLVSLPQRHSNFSTRSSELSLLRHWFLSSFMINPAYYRTLYSYDHFSPNRILRSPCVITISSIAYPAWLLSI